MKFVQIFTKTPNHKKFSYTPRFYDPREEERKERESRILKELADKVEEEQPKEEDYSYRQRIAGSFRQAKKTVTVQADPSASMIRLIIMLILTVGLIAYWEFGNAAIYGVAMAFIPFYAYLKFRKVNKRSEQ